MAKRTRFTIPLVHPRIVGWCYILWRRANAQLFYLLRWLIYVFNSVVNTKLPDVIYPCHPPSSPLWPRSQAGYLDIIYTDPDKLGLHTYMKEERLFFEVKLNGRHRNSLLSPFKHRRLRSLGLVLELIYQLFAARLSTRWARSIKCSRKVCLQFSMKASLLRFKW